MAERKPTRRSRSDEAQPEPQSSGGQGGDHPERATSPLEWVAAALGGLLVLFVLGFLAYAGFTQSGAPPDPVVQAGEVTEVDAGYVVAFTVDNVGPTTAAALRIVGELRDGEAVVEESEATLDYVPGESERRGGLFFRSNPAEHDLVLNASGYAEP